MKKRQEGLSLIEIVAIMLAASFPIATSVAIALDSKKVDSDEEICCEMEKLLPQLADGDSAFG